MLHRAPHYRDPPQAARHAAVHAWSAWMPHLWVWGLLVSALVTAAITAMLRRAGKVDRHGVPSGGWLLSWQVGIDPLQDYLSTTLARWGATHVGSRWFWRDSALGESVTLIYQPTGTGVRALPRPAADLVIVHYTPPNVGR